MPQKIPPEKIPSEKSAAFLADPKFRHWVDAVTASGCRFHSAEALHLTLKKDGGILFGLFSTQVVDPEGRRLLPLLLLRGQAVVIVTLLRNEATSEERFLMVRQRRIANGALSLEFPAGMLDHEFADPVRVAVREVEEETGLRVEASRLFPLAEKPLFSSPGLDDEAIHFYGCEIALGDAEYRSLQGRVAGLADEGEHIEVGLWREEEALAEATSLQVRLAFALYREWRSRGEGR